MSKRKRFELSLLFGLIFTVIICLAGFDNKCEGLKKGIFRLRIIANSDEQTDQNVKLAVRDRILTKTADIFSNCKSVDEAKKAAKDNAELINDTVKTVLMENGCEYSFESAVKKEFFNIRQYEDFTLPAGEYESLVITLGKAKGHNWWCVIFPGVCVPAAQSKRLSDTLDDKDTEIAYNPDKYEMRFKISEIYEKLKEKNKKHKK